MFHFKRQFICWPVCQYSAAGYLVSSVLWKDQHTRNDLATFTVISYFSEVVFNPAAVSKNLSSCLTFQRLIPYPKTLHFGKFLINKFVCLFSSKVLHYLCEIELIPFTQTVLKSMTILNLESWFKDTICNFTYILPGLSSVNLYTLIAIKDEDWVVICVLCK